LFVRKTRRAGYVYVVSRGRVRLVAVALPSVARRAAGLRSAVRLLVSAQATQAPQTFVPNATARSAKLTGTTLAGSSDPRLNSAFALLCSL
jgi:hypothetical protein